MRHFQGQPPPVFTVNWNTVGENPPTVAEQNEAERLRVDVLSLWERIDECNSIEDIKAVLHVIRAKLEGSE